jgi:BTB/POZ domain/Kelch motif
MTLTALRGRLYLFGGSGTSAKCFQDLQILDRHEMAWLDVVSENEQNNIAGNNNNNNIATINISSNGGGGVNNNSNSTNYDTYGSSQFRFGGNQMYSDGNSRLTDDGVGAMLGGGSAEIIAARPQQGGALEYSSSSSSYGNVNNDPWRASSSLLDHHHQHHASDNSRIGAAMYSSPNPNDEDTVPSIFVRGHGPGRRAGHTATAVNRKIYVFGGSCGSDYLNDFFVLDTDPPPSAVVTETNSLMLMERRLRHFFNDPEFADVVFIVGENRDKVYGHKMVLSIVSDCFRAMFTTGFKESADTEICIPDCSHQAFLAVMEYIYTGNLPARTVICTESNIGHYHHVDSQQRQHQPTDKSIFHPQHFTRIVEILELADRFFLDHLKQICESILQSAVQNDTVEFLLSVAQKTNSSQLQSICQHFCRNHPQRTSRSSSTNNTLNTNVNPHSGTSDPLNVTVGINEALK